MVCVHASISSTKPSTTFRFLLEQIVCIILFPLFLHSFFLFFLSLREFPPHFIDYNSLLLLLFLSKLLLLLHYLSLYFLIFEFLLFLQLNEIIFESVHKSLNIFVRSKLPTVSNLFSTKRAFFFAKTIVRFNTIITETMQATFVNHWIVNHFLANWACQIFSNTSHKVLAYHIMQY
jgi:hypothetical protein